MKRALSTLSDDCHYDDEPPPKLQPQPAAACFQSWVGYTTCFCVFFCGKAKGCSQETWEETLHRHLLSLLLCVIYFQPVVWKIVLVSLQPGGWWAAAQLWDGLSTVRFCGPWHETVSVWIGPCIITVCSALGTQCAGLRAFEHAIGHLSLFQTKYGWSRIFKPDDTQFVAVRLWYWLCPGANYFKEGAWGFQDWTFADSPNHQECFWVNKFLGELFTVWCHVNMGIFQIDVPLNFSIYRGNTFESMSIPVSSCQILCCFSFVLRMFWCNPQSYDNTPVNSRLPSLPGLSMNLWVGCDVFNLH